MSIWVHRRPSYRTLPYGVPLWQPSALHNMATMMAPVGGAAGPVEVPSVAGREVVRCDHCKLVQFRSTLDCCRRCRRSLLPEPPRVEHAIALVAEPVTPSKPETLSVAQAVRDLRHVRNLSQRQLAGRMGVPRTYISKIENGKAMPTLSSLERLARALQVDISALLRDAPNRAHDETAMLTADPFLAELARYSAHLTSTQKSIFLNHVREMAQTSGQLRNRRTA